MLARGLHDDRALLAPRPVDETLDRLGATAADFDWPNLRLMAGEQRIARQALTPLTLATVDLDEFKFWIGFDDGDVRQGRVTPTPQRPERDPASATALDVRRAMASYVFGDSALWRAWRPAIEAAFPRLEVDVLAVGTLRLHRRSRFVVAGRPVVFMARRLVFEGGRFISTVDGRYAVDGVENREAA